LFLAGGLGPDNVASAIAAARPFAVDASSRLERAPGQKDPERLAAFFAAIARAREEILEDPHSGRLHGE
jgi:phosphoribosylanthranilate isomerase